MVCALVLFVVLGAVGCVSSGDAELAGDAAPEPQVGLLGCGGQEPYFPRDVLVERAAAAEDGDSDATRALRATLDGSDGSVTTFAPGLPPAEGWIEAVRDDERALFLHDSELLPALSYERRDGRWRLVAGSSACGPRAVSPGLGSAEWHLTEDDEPADAEVTANVRERACHGGEPTEADRILEPHVDYRRDAVVITFFVEPAPSSPGHTYTCPGHPPTPHRLVLDERVGDRQLLDGGTFPPSAAQARP